MWKSTQFLIPVCAVIFLSSCSQDAPTEVRSASQIRAPQRAKVTGNKIPNQYIVRLRDDVAVVDRAAADVAAAHGGRVRRVFKHAIKGFSVEIPDAAATALARNPRVLYVEQNQSVRAIVDQPNATWGIDRVDQRDLPLSSTYAYNATGDGVDAYIIDTGVLFVHSEFGGRAVSGPDYIDWDGYADDCNGHGTHVAGTVGGATYGVAKNVRIISVRVLDCDGYGTYEGVIAGVDWVTWHHESSQPAVANMSLLGYYFQALNDAVTNAMADGVVFAVAAGNSGEDACFFSPASTPGALTVGATSISDTEAWFSNRGSCLDIWAPGVDVTSAYNYWDQATETLSGTSMATPHVAGAVALYLQGNPAATPGDVETALKSNATTGKLTWDDPWGYKPPPPPPGADYLLYTAFISAPTPPPPAAPSGLTAVAGDFNLIELAWTDGASNENAFRIERCQDAESPCTNFAEIAQVGANIVSYQDWTVSSTSTYRYRVRAYNSGGNSGYSGEAAATTPAPPPPPSAPSSLIATPVSMSEIDLAWTDNSDNEAYFIIERCQDFGTPCTDFSFIGSINADVTAFRDEWLFSSTTYRYRVSAVGVGGMSGYSNEAAATTPAPPPPPTAPSSLTANAVSISQINLAWADNSADEAGFTVERCTGAGCTNFVQITQLGANATSFTSSGLSSNTTYRYRIRAFSAFGWSGYSNDAEARTLNQLPVAAFVWSCKNGNCTFNGSGSWDPDGTVVSYAWNFGDGTPAGSGSSPSHNYRVRANYNVTLTVTDNSGGTTARTCEITATVGKAKSGGC